MHSHHCLAVLFAVAVLYSSPVLAADTCNYPAGYICYDNLVFRPNGMGPWGAFSKGDGKATNSFAAKACANGDFEGKSGWRLPTEKELLAFVSSDVRPRKEGNGWVLNGGATWTSTPNPIRPDYFRYVSLRLDMVDKGQFPGYDARYVTCVREADISSGLDASSKNDSAGSTSPSKGKPGSDSSPAPSSSTRTEGKASTTQATKVGSPNTVNSSTADKSHSYAPGTDNKSAAQPAQSSKSSLKKPDNGCWNAGPLSEIYVSSKPSAALCSKNCMTVTVKNSSEGRIVADVCLHRQDGRPKDCGQIAVLPGGSNSYGGEGSDYSINYWGSNKPANDWTCKP